MGAIPTLPCLSYHQEMSLEHLLVLAGLVVYTVWAFRWWTKYGGSSVTVDEPWIPKPPPWTENIADSDGSKLEKQFAFDPHLARRDREAPRLGGGG
jgi:hypothetical protein